jgi:hypothetical protein
MTRPQIRTTHTLAVLEVSAEAFAEIKAKLEAAGYEHAIDMREGTIDMTGIALGCEPSDPDGPVSPNEAAGALDGGGPA